MTEYIMVWDNVREIPGQPGTFLVPLLRGYLQTQSQGHKAGLWVIVAAPAPSSFDDLAHGPHVTDIALKLPEMLDNTTGITVSRRVANYLDVGYVLKPLTIIE